MERTHFLNEFLLPLAATVGLHTWQPSCPEMSHGRMSIYKMKTPAVGNVTAANPGQFELHWGVFESMSWGNTLSPYWMARAMAGASHPYLSLLAHIY